MRIRFDDTKDVSPGFFFYRFRPTEPNFTLDYSTTNVDEAIAAAETLAQKLGRPIGVIHSAPFV